MTDLESRVAAIEDDVKKIKVATEAMNELLQTAHGLTTAIAMLTKFSVWISKVGIAVAVIWGLVFAWKHGTPPPSVSP